MSSVDNGVSGVRQLPNSYLLHMSLSGKLKLKKPYTVCQTLYRLTAVNRLKECAMEIEVMLKQLKK